MAEMDAAIATDMPAENDAGTEGASERGQVAATAATTDAQALAEAATRRSAPAVWREADERTMTPVPAPQALQLVSDTTGQGQAMPDSGTHSADASEPVELAAVSSSRARTVGQHVLLVDDTADVLVAVGAFLLGEGFVVVSAADGDTALRLLSSDPNIRILITDYVMPGLSGVELIAQALQIRPNLKALLITGYPNADGLADLPPQIKVLPKPFRRANLIAQVRSLASETAPMLPDEAMELVQNG